MTGRPRKCRSTQRWNRRPRSYANSCSEPSGASGHGSLASAFAASLLLGVGSTAAKYFYPEYSSLVFFGLMFLMLKLRPNGILSK